MKTNSIGNPAGFRDILFDEARRRRTIETSLAQLFEQKGYREIAPAGVEFYDLYARGNQSIKDRAFRFLDREDHLLALRADFTPAIARIVAARLLNTEFPIRVWYCGNVFRRVELHRGLFRETTQVGAELLGNNSTQSDAEMISLALEGMTTLGINDVQLHLNHAGIFKGIVDTLRLEAKALEQLTFEIDRKDTRGLAARLRQIGVSNDVAKQLDALSRCTGGEDVLFEAQKVLTAEGSRRALDELVALSKTFGSWSSRVIYDLTEIDEMEYYTGIMFRFFSPKLNRELGRGGRYDDLLAEFGAPMPAVGFSFSMESLSELA